MSCEFTAAGAGNSITFCISTWTTAYNSIGLPCVWNESRQTAKIYFFCFWFFFYPTTFSFIHRIMKCVPSASSQTAKTVYSTIVEYKSYKYCFSCLQNDFSIGLDLSEARASLLSGDVVELSNATSTEPTSMKLVWEVSKEKRIWSIATTTN